MEIKDIVTLIEAVSKNNLTSFVLEENGTKLSLKREKERETRCDSRSSAWFCAGFRSSHDEPAGCGFSGIRRF